MSASDDSPSPFVTWKEEPTFRGTFSIISICLTTLTFCVWSAVHIDIPEHKKHMSLWKKLGWLFVGLFAPEMLVFIAYQQKRTAEKLLKEATEHLKTVSFDEEKKVPTIIRWSLRLWSSARQFTRQRVSRIPEPLPCPEKAVADLIHPSTPSSSSPSSHTAPPTGVAPIRKHKWTLVHGFYAAMGGFVFDTSGGPDFLPGSHTRAIVTPEGFLWLMKHEPSLIPDISEESILDRSKASGLAKTVALAQALWFCFSCASRRWQHLPLSLLEVSTLAHAVCTLVSYLLWWKKPLDIREPTLISSEASWDACALMSMRSHTRTYMLAGVIFLELGSELQLMHDLPTDIPPSSQDAIAPPPAPLDLPFGQFLGSTKFSPRVVRKAALWKEKLLFGDAIPWYYHETLSSARSVRLEEHDIRRWCLAWRALGKYGFPDDVFLVSSRAELGASAANGGQDAGGVLRALSAAAVLAAIYGTPHIIAWNTTFPSHVEQWLWRGATIAVASFGLSSGLIFGVTFLISGDKAKDSAVQNFLIAILAVVYVGASSFLVAESVRQLFRLPPEAYELPRWSNYFPHFT